MTLEQNSSLADRESINKGSSSKRTLGRVLGALLGILISIGILIPAWFNVDQYRPTVTRELEKRIDGRVELGRLSLTLWGRIAVGVAGVRVLDSAGGSVLKVSDAAFYFPLWPLLTGKPVLQFEMNRPEVHLVRRTDGVVNLAALFKKERSKSGSPAAQTEPQTSQSEVAVNGAAEDVVLPGLVASARLGVILREASLDWADEKSGASGVMDRLNFQLENLSLSEPAVASLWGDLDARSPGGTSFQGPFQLDASFAPGLSVDRNSINLYNITLTGDFSRLEVSLPGKFLKPAGIPASLKARVILSESQWKLEDLSLRLQDSVLRLAGSFIPATVLPQSPVVELKLVESALDLGELAALAPSLKSHEIQGRGAASGVLSGPTERLTYSGKIELSDVRFKSTAFQVKPSLTLKVDISTDRIDQFQLSLQAPGNDLQLSGKLTSFISPRAELRLQSSGLDLDQLLVVDSASDTPMPASTPAPASSSVAAAPGGVPRETVPALGQGHDWDSWLAEPAAPDWMLRASLKTDIDLQSFKLKGVVLGSVSAAMSLQDMVFSLQKGAFKAFGGTGGLDARVDLKASPPRYQFSAQARELDLQKAVDSQLGGLKNTVIGTARFSIEGSGSSFNSAQARQNLKASGSFEVANAKFVTADLGKVAIDGLNSAISGIADRIPPLAGFKFDPPAAEEIRYESLSATFSIADGLFKMPDFAAKAQPHHGVDVRGRLEVGLKDDHALAGRWEIIDTHNFTQARELSVEVAGVRVDNLLAEGKGPVKFPVSVGCTTSSPCFSYAEAPEYLGRIALGKMEKTAGKKLGVKLKAAAESGMKELERKASPGIKKTLKGLNDLLKKR